MLFSDVLPAILFFFLYIDLAAAAPASNFVVAYNATPTTTPIQLPSEPQLGHVTANGGLSGLSSSNQTTPFP